MDQQRTRRLEQDLAGAAQALALPLTTDQLQQLATQLASRLATTAPEGRYTEQPRQDDAERTGTPRTLQQKLAELRELKTPPGEKKLISFRRMAREITAAGTPISDTHIRNLFSGEQPSPKKVHLEALAAYFGVPAGFLLDDFETARIEPQLRLLESLKGTDGRVVALLEEAVRSAELVDLALEAAGLSPASLEALKQMARHLRGLESNEPPEE